MARTPRRGAGRRSAQNCQTAHLVFRRRSVDGVHGERVRPPRVGGFPARRERVFRSSTRDDSGAYARTRTCSTRISSGFDGALMRCDERRGGLLRANENLERKNAHHVKDDTGVLAFHCGRNLIVANLHPTESYPYYKVGSEFGEPTSSSSTPDAVEFGGYGRLDKETAASTESGACDWLGAGVCLCCPAAPPGVRARGGVGRARAGRVGRALRQRLRVRERRLRHGGGETTPCGSEVLRRVPYRISRSRSSRDRPGGRGAEDSDRARCERDGLRGTDGLSRGRAWGSEGLGAARVAGCTTRPT